jgi:hypothetical protein
MIKIDVNKTCHVTAIPLRSIAAGEMSHQLYFPS